MNQTPEKNGLKKELFGPAARYCQAALEAASCAELVLRAPDSVVGSPAYPDAGLVIANTLLDLGMTDRATAVIEGINRRLPEGVRRDFLRQVVCICFMHPDDMHAESLPALVGYRSDQVAQLMANFVDVSATVWPEAALESGPIIDALKISPAEIQHQTIVNLQCVLNRLPAEKTTLRDQADDAYRKRKEELELDLPEDYRRQKFRPRGIRRSMVDKAGVQAEYLWMMDVPDDGAKLLYVSSGEPDDAAKLLLLTIQTRIHAGRVRKPDYPDAVAVLEESLDTIDSPVGTGVRRQVFDRLQPQSDMPGAVGRAVEVYFRISRFITDPVLASALTHQPNLPEDLLSEAVLKALLSGSSREWYWLFMTLSSAFDHDRLRADLIGEYAKRKLTGCQPVRVGGILSEYFETERNLSWIDRKRVSDLIHTLLPPESQYGRFTDEMKGRIASRIGDTLSAILMLDADDRTMVEDSEEIIRLRVTQASLFLDRQLGGLTGEALLEGLSRIYTLGPVKVRALVTQPIDWSELSGQANSELLSLVERYREEDAEALIRHWRDLQRNRKPG